MHGRALLLCLSSYLPKLVHVPASRTKGTNRSVQLRSKADDFFNLVLDKCICHQHRWLVSSFLTSIKIFQLKL